MIIAQTERLLIRQLTVDDAPFILKLVNEPAWLAYIGDKGVRTVEDAVNYILSGPMKSYEANGFGLWLVQLAQSNEPIGMCGLIKRDTLPLPDIGFAFLAAHNSKGYAHEAATAVLDYARNKVGLLHLLAIVNQDNVRSIHLLEKLGFRFERLFTMPGEQQPIRVMGASLEPLDNKA
jgi:[ribosomal protein S5]-alanine N-acetyltransferase